VSETKETEAGAEAQSEGAEATETPNDETAEAAEPSDAEAGEAAPTRASLRRSKIATRE
jgi:hypothetical protein